MTKEEKLQITKDKLLDATWELMESSDDPLQVTSRQIAARADVKPSMINYCFGSREDLIFNTFQKQYLDFKNDEVTAKIIASGRSPKDIIKELHFYISELLVNNHNFTRAITPFVLFKRDLAPASFSLPYVMRHYGERKSEEECRLIAYELSSMMQLIIYRKDDIRRDFKIDLDDKEQLRHYIEMRVDLLLEG